MKQEIQKIKNTVSTITDMLKSKKASDTFLNKEYINIDYLSSYVEQLQKEVSELEKICNYNSLQESKSEQKETTQKDNVNHPSHYSYLKELCGVEVIDITRHLDFDTGNAVKYLLRAGHKSEEGYTDKDKAIEDLKKAVFYINDKIKMLEKGK